MTDRIHSLTVVLEKDMREDECEKLICAIMMLRGVLDVTTHIVDANSYMAETRAKSELNMKLFKVIYPVSRTAKFK